MEAVVKVDDVSKRYYIGASNRSVKSLLRDGLRGNRRETHWAVKDVSFNVEAGEALGIIGPNGAGKTTLLKLLSRVTHPTAGEIRVNGRLSALIELGAGFHPDLTGRENIYLNGRILGMRGREIDERFERIVTFANIGAFLDTPVKRYSSGMYARLGFAIAAHVDPEILLVDEVLSVGDMAFRAKCYRRMNELIAKGTSLVFVSHDLIAVRRVCERVLVMYGGRPAFVGSADEAVARYSDLMRKAAEKLQGDPGENGLAERRMSGAAKIEDVSLVDKDGTPTKTISSGSPFGVLVKVRFLEDAPSPVFAFSVRTPEGLLIYDTTTRWQGMETRHFRANEEISVRFSGQANLIEGIYQVGVDLAYEDLGLYYDRIENALSFTVKGDSGSRGIAELETVIEFKAESHGAALNRSW